MPLTTKLLRRKPLPSSFPVAATASNVIKDIALSISNSVAVSGYARWHSNATDEEIVSGKLTDESCYSNPSPGKIAVAMSGGVDSSVVAYLLSKRHSTDDLIGIHMSNWDYADEDPTVTTTMKSNKHDSYCWEQDWKDTSAVATQLKIPIHHVSFQAEYWNEVFQPYCQKLSQSITPNPDVDCNRYIKFGALKEYLNMRFSSGVDFLATGHYARLWDRSRTSHNPGSSRGTTNEMPMYLRQALEEEESTILADYILHPSVADIPLLLSARDRSKDQSYFLSGVPAKAFSGVIFPLGDLYKTEHSKNPMGVSEDCIGKDISDSVLSVRQLAQQARLPNATKRDSVGICFIGKRKHGNFINEYVEHPLGDNDNRSPSSSTSSLVKYINVENNKVVATFDPVENPASLYATIGQGAKISGAGQKWFVVDKQLQPPQQGDTIRHAWKSPCIVICPGTHHPSLYADSFYVKSQHFNWIAGGEANRPPPLPFRAKCRIRHLQPLVDCEITAVDKNYKSCHKILNNGGVDCEHYEIKLKIPLRGIAPGQICVIYAGGAAGDLICLGGGPIDQAGQNYWEMQRDLPDVLHPSGHNDSSLIQRERKMGSEVTNV